MSDPQSPIEGLLLPPSPSGREGVSLAAGVDHGQAAVAFEAEKNLGKGWTTGGSWQWAKTTGNRIMGFLTWTPRPK